MPEELLPFQLRLTRKLHTKLKHLSVRKRMSINKMFLAALDKWLEDDKPKTTPSTKDGETLPTPTINVTPKQTEPWTPKNRSYVQE